jgi:hypothetical protein
VGPVGGLQHSVREGGVGNTQTPKKMVSGSRLECWVNRRGVHAPFNEGVLVTRPWHGGSKRPAGGKRYSGCDHDSNPGKRINGSASVILSQEQSQQHSLLFSCSITTFAVRLRSRCRIPVARLGRGTQTREPLDAATLRLLMTFLSLWLPCVGLRI